MSREFWNTVTGLLCFACGFEAMWKGAKYEGLNMVMFSMIFLELNNLKARGEK